MPVPTTRRPPALSTYLGLAAIAVAGGLLASVPALVAGEAVGYLEAWLRGGTVDPTWNDGDAVVAFTAAAVVVVIMAAVAVGSAIAARRRSLHPAGSAVAAVAVAAGIAALPYVLFLPGG
ncbi:hypothetical protein [Leifsonia sp. fls2-241-R2A-40a]|uniref:hypothetical protein n=1 Tax=Leifsonia sp. fls2-241-R2A-40a TaxID=3040290 RepID=UPI00254BA16D|nr:hypothetical protein [Leifsonia sp. fls2-241-R2A-40a]